MLCHVTRALRTPTGALVPPPLPWPVRMFGRPIKRHALGDAPQRVFFGPMMSSEWGRLMFKHIDHHFRQFGV